MPLPENMVMLIFSLLRLSGVRLILAHGCEDLALDFAQWLSVDFRLWCLDRIKELLTTGKCVIPDFNDPPAAAEAWAKEYRGRVAAEKLALEESQSRGDG